MYLYELSCDNPEGIEWLIRFQSEKQYSNDEFQDKMESILLETCKDNMEKDLITGKPKAPFLAMFSDKLIPVLEKHGFIMNRKIFEASYGIEPYWGTKCIKNDELRKMYDEKYIE